MEDRYIVTIDLGTSKIALTVAQVQGNNTQVVYYKEHASEGIVKGEVFSETKVGNVIKMAKEQAEDALNITITQAAVSLPRYYVKQFTNQAEMGLNPDTAITEENIGELMSIAKDTCPIENPDEENVYDAVAQSYSDGEDFQIKEEDIVGLERERIEGNFKIFVGKKKSLKRIDSAFAKAELTPIKVFTPDHTARAVLSKSDRENGVALIEIGAGVTSVSVYLDDVMRYYGSFPFGGDIVTSDIQQDCNLTKPLSEEVKKGYGICLPERLQTLAEKKLVIRGADGDDKQVAVKALSEIVTARMQEIADAALYLIQDSGLYDELRCGIVLTGGGANIVNGANLFFEKSGYATKVCYPKAGFEVVPDTDDVFSPEAAASIGLLNAAKAKTTNNFAKHYAPLRTIAKPKPVAATPKPAYTAPKPAEPKPVEPADDTLFVHEEPVAPQPKKVEVKPTPEKKPKLPWWKEKLQKKEEEKKVAATQQPEKADKPKSVKPATTEPNTGKLGGWVQSLFEEDEDNNV